MSEIDILIITACLYVSIGVSFFFYSLVKRDVYGLLNRSLKGAKIKKDLNDFNSSATRNMKLSLIWPVALCLILINKRKS